MMVKKKKPTSKISNTYINKVDKKQHENVIFIKANKGNGTKCIWVSKEIISIIKIINKVWASKWK
jgi:hypothetical protein